MAHANAFPSIACFCLPLVFSLSYESFRYLWEPLPVLPSMGHLCCCGGYDRTVYFDIEVFRHMWLCAWPSVLPEQLLWTTNQAPSRVSGGSSALLFHRWLTVGHVGLSLSLISCVIVVNVIMFSVAFYFAYFVLRMYTVLVTFLFSKVLSFLYWFVWTAPYFSFKYPIDRRFFYRELRKQQELDAKRGKIKSPGPRVNSGTGLLRDTDDDK